MRLVERYLEEAENVPSLERSPRSPFSDPHYAIIGESTGPQQ